MTAAFGPSNDRNRSSWERIPTRLASSVSRSSRLRSAEVPDGSPIMPSRRRRDDGPTAPLLEVGERRDRHEVADVERRAGRIEPVVGGDLPAGRQTDRESRRRVVEEAPPAQLVEEPGGGRRRVVRGAVRRRGRHGHVRWGVSPQASRKADRTSPCYRARRHADQPGAAPASSKTWHPPAASRLRRAEADAVAIPIILVAAVIAAGVTGLLGVVAAYSYYERGLPNPEAALADLEFDQQTVVTDRTGTIEMARLGERKREIVVLRADAGGPRRRPRSRTRTSGSTPASTWPASSLPRSTRSNGRPRGGSITQRLVRARLLLPPSAFEGSREERKIREIIQSLRLTQAYPGEKASDRSSRPTSTRASTATSRTA